MTQVALAADYALASGDAVVTNRVVSVGGVRVAARMTGSGEPCLLLNGLSRPMQSWASFGDALHGRTIITFDVPGVGQSHAPVVPYTMSMLSNIAVGVLDAFGVDAADIVGFSFGGALAQQIAIGHPKRVKRLVLLATSCGIGAVPGRGRDVTRSLLRPNDGTRWAAPDPMGLLYQLGAISTWTSIPYLGSIAAPTLLICGDGDKAIPPANSRLLAARIPNARLATVGAGHDLQKPGAAPIVAALVQRFLDGEDEFAAS